MSILQAVFFLLHFPSICVNTNEQKPTPPIRFGDHTQKPIDLFRITWCVTFTTWMLLDEINWTAYNLDKEKLEKKKRIVSRQTRRKKEKKITVINMYLHSH